MSRFEPYLSLWVALCIGAGVLLGKSLSSWVSFLRTLGFGSGSHINLPIAVLIRLRIVPMMMKVDFAAIGEVGGAPGACGSLCS